MSTFMIVMMMISLVIILFILVIFTAAISKGYSYKHTVDRLEDNPNVKKEDNKRAQQ
ncbi:YtzI protein [Fictibacillus iocasae]|uniref:YtzI protein n=1 Tax=Fictibacillus iocasae TaxID=2715437 RepID=A0ABW2NIC4_9BACL